MATLDTTELKSFQQNGVLVPRRRLAERAVDEIIEQLPALARAVDATAFETDGRTPRALHGGHEDNPILHRLVRLSALVEPAEQILGDRVYVYQFKVNLKAAFAGDLWPWHQDYSFWLREDGMPTPRALTVAIFLDDVTEFNGPMYFIPGSHLGGCHDGDTTAVDAPAAWQRHVAASLSYQTDRRRVTALATQRGIVAPKGPRGTLLFFDCNVVHASPANVSPMARRMLLVTYNSVSNAPDNIERPTFLVNRDCSPLDARREAGWFETAIA